MTKTDAAPVVIRAAVEADSAALAALANALHRALGAAGDAMTPGLAAEALIGGRYGVEALVAAADGGDLVGYALHRPDFETSVGLAGRYVPDLYVAPEWRRRGVGRALLGHVAEIAAAEGGSYLWWLTVAPEGAAGRFYKPLAAIRQQVTSFAAATEDFNALRRAARRWRGDA